jgi:hypothetical protein
MAEEICDNASTSSCPGNGQPAPYPSLAVQAPNGRVADQPTGTSDLELQAVWMSASACWTQLRIMRRQIGERWPICR